MTKFGMFNNASEMTDEALNTHNQSYEHTFEPLENPFFSSTLPPHLRSQQQAPTQENEKMQKGDYVARKATEDTIIESKMAFKKKFDAFKEELKKEIAEEIDETSEKFMKELGLHTNGTSNAKMKRMVKKNKPKKGGCNCW